MTKHTGLENATERPWVIRENMEEGVFCNSFSIETKEKVSEWFGERVICRLPTGFDRENKANAALIVRCVNSHDALVEAVKGCLESQSIVLDMIRNGANLTDIETEQLNGIEIAETALKLAKGE